MSEDSTSVQDTPTGQEELATQKAPVEESGKKNSSNVKSDDGLFDSLISDEKGDEGKSPEDAGGDALEEPNDPDLEKLKPDLEVPEKPFEGKIGDYTVKLPAGIRPDDPQVVQFAEILKKSEVKGEKVQGLVDLFIENRKKAGEELMDLDKKFREKLNDTWIEQNRRDPEIGGGGSKLSATANYTQKALRTLFTKKELMQTTETDGVMGFLEFVEKANIKNAPPFVKLLARIGRKLSESTPISSSISVPKGEAKLRKDVLFGEIDG